MPDFRARNDGPEVMDDLQVSGRDLHQALRELDSINRLLGGTQVTLNALSQLLEGYGDEKDIHIADLGCGSGDTLKQIRKLLDKRKIRGSLTGFDANANVIEFATTHTPPSCRVEYEPVNIFSEEFKTRRFDIVTGTLFFHHFSSEQLKAFLAQLRSQVTTGIVINDIHRHWFAYYSIQWLTRIFSRSPMVKNDAPVSVMRAFKKGDLLDILDGAGLVQYRIRWCWAFRWQVVIRI
jgi:2-polyprenyl-3-methyl-5-hydroxy-6-metoxy-1,4-benzoquinol methylase